jgi:anhydro-N-acetylmuramic acid kinase
LRRYPRLSAADRLATLCAFTAWGVKRATARLHAFPRALYLTGGGVHNRSLVRAIEHAMAPIPVKSVAELGFNPNALEAVSFALLGYCCIQRIPLDLRGSTGAARPAVLGRLSWP